MNDEQLATFRETVDDGIDCDGLVVEPEGHDYLLETADGDRRRIARDELSVIAEEMPWYVSNWYYWRRVVGDPDTARYAFLRWLERADERPVPERYEALAADVCRSWGQLLVTASLGTDGRRRYSLRHEDDADRSVADLDVYVDPTEAREIATVDDRGRYRPLSTAPTLRSGWVFVDLDGYDLVRTIEYFYPATIANWHLERRGELDVTHFRETAGRQTGMLSAVSDLSGDAVDAAAQACCVDSQCLKRRVWDEEGDRKLSTPRGEGEFPCREPCSLFLTAARAFGDVENEHPETVSIELTPSERVQLAAIVDRVAEGTLGEVREGDVEDPANRYRVRYLRTRLRDRESFQLVSEISDEIDGQFGGNIEEGSFEEGEENSFDDVSED